MKLDFNSTTNAIEQDNTVSYIYGEKRFKDRAISKLKGFALTTVLSAVSFHAFAHGKHENIHHSPIHKKITIAQPHKQAVNNKMLVQKVSRQELVNVQEQANKSGLYNIPISANESDNNIDLAKKYYQEIKNSPEGDDRVINYAICIALANEGYSDGKTLDAQHHLTTGYGYDLTVQKRDYGMKKVAYDLAKAGVNVDKIMLYAEGKSRTMHLTKEESLKLMKVIMPDYAQFAKSWGGPEIWGLDTNKSEIIVNDGRDWNSNDFLKNGGIYKSVYVMNDIQKAATTYAAYNTGSRAMGSDFKKHWMEGDVLGAISSIKVVWKDRQGVNHVNQRLMNNLALAFNGDSTIQTVISGNSDQYINVDQISALTSVSPDSIKAMKFETAYRKSISKMATLDTLKENGKTLSASQERLYQKEKTLALKTFASTNTLREKLGEDPLTFYNPYTDIIKFQSQQELDKAMNASPKSEMDSKKFAATLFNKLEQTREMIIQKDSGLKNKNNTI